MTNIKAKAKPSGPRKACHLFRKIRDPLVSDATSLTPSIVGVATNGSGVGSSTQCMAPLGVYTTQFTAGVPSLYQAFNAPLPFMYNMSRNFGEYKVTRANLIFIGLLGSNSTGSITLFSSTNYSDVLGINIGPALSTGSKVFELADIGNNECKIPLKVDPVWKKVSSNTTIVNSAISGELLTINSIDDVSFTFFTWSVTGAATNVTVGQMYVEYDVEFRFPQSFAVTD